MKQKPAESRDFKNLLYLSIYFSNNLLRATIQFRMRRLISPMTRCRISAGIDSMISLTCSLAGITATVTEERYVEMLQKIFPEDSPDISSVSCVHAGWSTGTDIEDGNGVVEGSLSR